MTIQEAGEAIRFGCDAESEGKFTEEAVARWTMIHEAVQGMCGEDEAIITIKKLDRLLKNLPIHCKDGKNCLRTLNVSCDACKRIAAAYAPYVKSLSTLSDIVYIHGTIESVIGEERTGNNMY